MFQMVKRIMTYFFLFCAAFILIATEIKAQETEAPNKKWIITTGFGYYKPLHNPGDLFYSEIGYRLSTGYNIGFGFGLGTIFDRYRKGSLFEGMRTYKHFYLYRLFIKRPFEFGSNNKNKIKIGIGIVYIQPRYSHPLAYIEQHLDGQGNIISKLIIGQDKTDPKQSDLGFPVTFEYGYNFDPLVLGFRGEVYPLSTGGFYGFILSPQVSLNF
jgi:hypothetical protein